jgi:phytoene dehydrogenase-like protein
MTYDAIIIGAGHNGIVTGIYLAKVGWKVLVLERNDEPGGAVRTAEVTLPGFRHDLFATNLNLFAGSPNRVGGDSVCGSHHLYQNYFMRPFPGWSRYKTPIKNLYIVGVGTWPGAGVGAGSGRLLGKMLTGK